MTRLLALMPIAVAAYACDLDGLPPDLAGLVGAGAIGLVVGIGAFSIGRWNRG